MRIPGRQIALPLYALLAYGTFAVSLVWTVGFLADARRFPTVVDGGPTSLPRGWALAVDLALLSAFALQHTVMARPAAKRLLGRIQPRAAERSTYVLASSLILALALAAWEPLTAPVWRLGPPWSVTLWVLYGLGWALVIAATFMVDHADFLGLKQAFRAARGRPHADPVFTERLLYAWCRHPMMLGLLVVFWSTPELTAGHLVFALAGTGYILVGTRFEEHDLRRHLGPVYDDYARRVPALVPRKPAAGRRREARPT